MPATRAASHAGDLSASHVRELAKLAGHPRRGRALPRRRAAAGRRGGASPVRRLVPPVRPLARRCRPRRPRRAPRSRPGAAPVHARARSRRRVPSRRVSHGDRRRPPWVVHSSGSSASSSTPSGRPPRRSTVTTTTTAHLARTPAQRRHDALVLMAERAMAAPADGKRPAPLVTVLVDYPTLAGRVCELAGSGTVLPPGDVLELLARDDTLLDRAVFRGANKIVDISSARTFRGTVRRVLDLVHRRCGHPTCFVPAEPVRGRSRGAVEPGRPDVHRQRPARLRVPQPLELHPPTNDQRPNPGFAAARTAIGCAARCDTADAAHWVLRVPRRRTPDISHPADRCSVDVSPARPDQGARVA